MRFLPVQSNSNASPFLHLTRLKSNNDFRIWWTGFNEHGHWNQALSLQASIINRQQRRMMQRTSSPRRIRGSTTLQASVINCQQTRMIQRTSPPRGIRGSTAPNTEPQLLRLRNNPQTRVRLTTTNVAVTASPFSVPFLCAVKGFPHPQIETVKNYMTLEIWDIMIRRTQYVHQYVQENGTNNEKNIH